MANFAVVIAHCRGADVAIDASNDADAKLAVARSLWENGHVAQSEAILRDLVARNPAREETAVFLATLLRNEGRLDAASQAMYDWCEACALAPGPGLRAAQFMQNCARQPLAARLCDAVLAANPALPDVLAVAGNIAREQGFFDEAREFYLEALAANVDLDARFVLGALAHTRVYTDIADPDFARFAAHFNDEARSPRSRAATGFGLAKALGDVGHEEAAVRTLRVANALVRAVQPWSATAWHQTVEARLRESLVRLHSVVAPDFTPIFVVGLPRTGTTLAATQLARLTGARDRGELRTLRFIVDRLVDGGHLGDRSALSEAAMLYRAHSRQDDAPAVAYIDQDPLNFRNLRFIEALFPNARIIHCQRDRRDTALSLWSQDFASGECAFAYDLADIHAYGIGHDRLMDAWKGRLSIPIHTLDYEAFVAQPRTTLTALAAAAWLPEIEATTEVATPIGSASVWQARQPVYASSVGRWRRYARFVPELTRLWPESY